jgi:hypothetical protein
VPAYAKLTLTLTSTPGGRPKPLVQAPFSRAALGTAGAVALLGCALFGSLPASAAPISATDCQALSGTPTVRATATNSGEVITLSRSGSDGHYEAQGSVSVYCRSGSTNLGEIPNERVMLGVIPTSDAVPAGGFRVTPVDMSGELYSDAAGNIWLGIGPFTGPASFNIWGPPSTLEPDVVAASLALQMRIVTTSGSLIDSLAANLLPPPNVQPGVAQTPELDSLALFASGGLGLLGYLGLRRRARGK